MVIAVYLYFHSCRYVFPFSFTSSSSVNTALLPVTAYKSRALLSIESPLANKESQDHALMTVSTGLTKYKDLEFKRQKRTITRSKMLTKHTPQTCSCSTRSDVGDDEIGVSKHRHNKTLLNK